MAERTGAKTPATRSRGKAKAAKEPQRQGARTPSRSSAAKPKRTPGATRSATAAATVSVEALPVDLRETFGAERLAMIRDALPPDASQRDFARLLTEAVRLGADPVRGDLYLKRGPSRDGAEFEYSVVAKRDTLLAYAQRLPEWAGMESRPIYTSDTYAEGDPEGHAPTLRGRAGVSHTSAHPKDRGDLWGAWCAVELHGKPPTLYRASAAEYLGTPDELGALDPEDPRRRFPEQCVLAAAQSIALRIGCSLTDVVGADEIRDTAPAALPATTAAAAAAQPAPPMSDGELERLVYGDLDDLDREVLGLWRELRSYTPDRWPVAKIRARLREHRDDADRTRLRDELLADLAPLRQRAEAQARRRQPGPEVLERRLAELRAFDRDGLAADDARELDEEIAVVERQLEARRAES